MYTYIYIHIYIAVYSLQVKIHSLSLNFNSLQVNIHSVPLNFTSLLLSFNSLRVKIHSLQANIHSLLLNFYSLYTNACMYIYVSIHIYIYIYLYIYPLIYTPLLKDTRVHYVGVEHKVEGKANGNLYPLRKSPSVRMSIKPQCTLTVWQCWRNEAQLAKHVKELLASPVVITLQALPDCT